MSGKRRTLWRGSLEISEEEELDIAIATHQPSLRGQETFDWKIKNDEVRFCSFKEMLIKQRIAGKLGSLVSEMSFEAKRRADIPPSERSGRGENHCLSGFLIFLVFLR